MLEVDQYNTISDLWILTTQNQYKLENIFKSLSLLDTINSKLMKSSELVKLLAENVSVSTFYSKLRLSTTIPRLITVTNHGTFVVFDLYF